MQTAAAQRVFEFMTANQAEYSIQLMSLTLGVSRSGFYACRRRPPSIRQLADEALSKRIVAVHKASKETYGAPRIHAELAEGGVQVGRKRIERLMKAIGLKGVSRRKFVVTTERNPRARPASDLVYRNFYAPSRQIASQSPAGQRMCESFFATLECELLDRREFKTKAEARVACFEFIERWYNPSRRHSALGYKSPINYEGAAAEGLESLSP